LNPPNRKRMRPLILITSCQQHLARNQQCRATWLQDCNVDYRFVLGNGNSVTFGDELILPVDDSYYGLPAKIQQSHKWALDNGYDYILKTDCDVYVCVARVFNSDFRDYDYTGNFYYPNFCMGAAYWLSRRATEILVNAPLPLPFAPGGDDVWVGATMTAAEIQGHHESRYYIGDIPDYSNCFSLHTSGPPKLDMFEIHRRMLEKDYS
jgi:hypothetical protein